MYFDPQKTYQNCFVLQTNSPNNLARPNTKFMWATNYPESNFEKYKQYRANNNTC